MKRIARTLIRLYPANWQQRYGEEFEALLEEDATTLSTVYDLLKGAFKMQLNVPSFPKMAVVLSLVGLLVGFGVSFAVNPRYVATATLTYNAASPRDFNGNLLEDFMQQQNQIESRTSLSNVIQDPRLDIYRDERSHLPLEDVIEKMRQDLAIRTVDPHSSSPESLAFHISFTYRDELKAQQTVQILITKFQDANLMRARQNQTSDRGYDEVDRLEQRLAAIEKRLGIAASTPNPEGSYKAASAGVNLNVVDPPALPTEPLSPKRSAFMLTGFGTGFALALLIAIFRRRSPPIPFPAQTV